MEKIVKATREQRLQKLFDECQQQVISQIIGPFGLSMAMFEDRNGGNVTTLHNFARDDADYIADKDLASHAKWKSDYNRKEYEDKPEFQKIREKKINAGVNEYTGEKFNPSEAIGPNKSVTMELDHIQSIKEFHLDPKTHLAHQTGISAKRAAEVINNEKNLALTDQETNRKKGAKTLEELNNEQGQECNLDQNRVKKADEDSKKHISSESNKDLLKKQTEELVQTGLAQALKMGMRQALGVLLTELVNGIFNEFKILIKNGFEFSKAMLREIKRRLSKVFKSVIAKVPDALNQMVKGGLSGFLSNLLTFIINNFLSTAKNIVTVIREGLHSLIKAFKFILFPPKNLTSEQALQEGLKILTTTVITSLGILFNESVKLFIQSMPFLQPFAETITPVLVGIITGLTSAFLAYQIDCYFNQESMDEKLLDDLFESVEKQTALANSLIELTNNSLSNISNYSTSIAIYQRTGINLAAAASSVISTTISAKNTANETNNQIEKSRAMENHLENTCSNIDKFLISYGHNRI